jgi:hypothetical protein
LGQSTRVIAVRGLSTVNGSISYGRPSGGEQRLAIPAKSSEPFFYSFELLKRSVRVQAGPASPPGTGAVSVAQHLCLKNQQIQLGQGRRSNELSWHGGAALSSVTDSMVT